MSLLGRERGKEVAEISIDYGPELTRLASGFGAKTRRDARVRPGSFGRPYVGSDPYYYERKACQVFRRAIKGNEELDRLYLIASGLGSTIDRSVTRPYEIGGPNIEAAAELLSTGRDIQDRLRTMDLTMPLTGKWLDRARDISAFALRVIEMDSDDPFVSLAKTLGERRGLYPGLPEDLAVNTAGYWQTLNAELTAGAQLSVPAQG